MNEWGLFLGSVVAGFITSFHCVGMCAPLSCSIARADSPSKNRKIFAQYHFGRMISYGILGSIAGGLGSVFFEGIPLKPLKIVGFFFLGVYFILAWGWEFKTTPGSWGFQLSRWTYPLVLRFKNQSGFSLGLITPLLPCTPLYLSTSAAFLSGSPFWGMWIMIGFVLGTVPIYGLSQLFWIRCQSLLSPERRTLIRRVIAILAVLIMSGRLYYGEFMNAAKPCHGSSLPCFPTTTK